MASREQKQAEMACFEFEEDERLASLSPAARKLWARVNDSNNFYLWGNKRTPKAMKELEEAGLIRTMSRVARVIACYVPVGTKPFHLEQFPEDTFSVSEVIGGSGIK